MAAETCDGWGKWLADARERGEVDDLKPAAQRDCGIPAVGGRFEGVPVTKTPLDAHW